MRRPRARLAVAVRLLLLVVAVRPAFAAEPALAPRYDLVRDGAITGAAAVTMLSLYAAQDQLAPERCRWCEPPGVDARISRALRWGDAEAAARTSDALALALGAGALGYGLLDGHRRGSPELGRVNALLVTEATSLAVVLDGAVKYAAGRQRPYAWRGEEGSGRRSERNLSFFSMHSTFAFAVASSSSTLLLSQRAPHARAYAAAAFGVAATIGYLRVAAERHYASDVLVGAGVGTLVGWAVPHFLHPAQERGFQLVPAPGGIAVVW